MDTLKILLARNRRNRVVRRLMAWLTELHRGYENLSYDFYSNGESRVLRLLSADSGVKTVFDVGANTGEWSTMAIRIFPDAQVHAFEIVPHTADCYRDNTSGLRQICFNSIGLSDREGSEQVFFREGLSPIATCVPNFVESFHRVETVTIPVLTTTGDLYCSARNIGQIDFLKIDVEGYEHKVLNGFLGMLSRQAIRAIQFEYGYVNVASRFLLKDFYDLLTSLGMVIGKIYPNYVDFRPYKHVHEDFLGPNYLAILGTEKELIRKLADSD